MSHASVIVALDYNGKHISDISIEQINESVAFQMMPFDENGDWFADGSRWDWYQIGGRYSGKFFGRDIIRREELTDDKMLEYNLQLANKLWNDYQNEKRKDDSFIRGYVYGLKDNDNLETIRKRYSKLKINAYAFLQNRRWYENGRLGWFGGNAKTECELNYGHTGTCLHKNEELDARIISYNYDVDGWRQHYFDKFLKDLKPDTILVNVDYHV